MNVVADVIDRFGGVRPMAAALGHKNPSTVQGWKERGVIPVRRLPSVIEAAESNGVSVSLDELVMGSAR